MDEISILQINLRKSSTANYTAIAFALTNKIDILLVQDPHISKNKLTYLPLAYSTYFSNSFTSGIVILNTKMTHIKTISFENSVFVNVFFKEKNVIFGSQYIAPSQNLDYDLQQ